MDTITFRQINGTNIFLVTNRDGDINYIETLDGYTLVLSTLGLYEYAKKGKGGDLVPSGLTAHNDFQRTDKEVKKLKKIPLHLRFGGDILKEKEKRANKYKNLNPKYEYRYEK
ncbi:MAG: hypothetical protein SGJ04_09665 [Bacteroidota bacterium]|nr:hypothetical protein [Bacteroidota bacterium]